MSQTPPENPSRDEINDADKKVVKVDFRAPKAAKNCDLPPSPRQTEKMQITSELLQAGMVTLIIDARREGVKVPPRFADDPQLRLNFSFRFFIEDFEVDEKGVRASLSFNQVPFFCQIPWDAIYAVQSAVMEQGVLWPDEVPEELKDLFSGLNSSKALALVQDPLDATEEGPVGVPEDDTEEEPSQENNDEVTAEDEHVPSPDSDAPKSRGLRLVTE